MKKLRQGEETGSFPFSPSLGGPPPLRRGPSGGLLGRAGCGRMCTWATCTWRVHGVCTNAFVLRVCWICGVCMSRQTAGGCWASTEHAFGVPIKAPHFVASAISGQTISGLQPPKRPSRDSLGSCVVVVCVSTVLGHCCRRATAQPPGGPKQQGQVVTCRSGHGHTQWIGVCRPWPSRPPSLPRVPRTAEGGCVRGGSAGTV